MLTWNNPCIIQFVECVLGRLINDAHKISLSSFYGKWPRKRKLNLVVFAAFNFHILYIVYRIIKVVVNGDDSKTHTSQFSLFLPPLPTLASQAEQSLVPRKANRQSAEPCASRYYICLPACQTPNYVVQEMTIV